MNKTVPTESNVNDFIASLEDVQQQKDSTVLITIMQSITGENPVLWGPSIIGFGTVHYKYASGREGDTPKIAFSPRKGKFALYITDDTTKYERELSDIGKHTVGKSCIYITRLADVDIQKLQGTITKAYNEQVSL